MKKFSLLLTALLMSLSMLAQAPQGINYQTVIRDGDGNLLPDTELTLQMTIRSGAPDGLVVYQETHDVMTNAFGLVNLVIGNGLVQTGNFAGIDWGADAHYLETAVEFPGSKAFQVMGVTQFLSVPYALEAKHASSLTLTDDLGKKYHIGVDENGNLVINQVVSPWQCGLAFIDARDGQSYETVQIGDQCWMAENLNIGTMILNTTNMSNNNILEKFCYDNNAANCDVYGGLYQWSEMMQYAGGGNPGICPANWHIPTSGDWDWAVLIYNGGQMKTTGTIEAGTGLWYAPNAGATNSSGFGGLPGGWYNSDAGNFQNQGYHTYFWSTLEWWGIAAYYRSLHYDSDFVNTNIGYYSYGLSVRCMKDQ